MKTIATLLASFALFTTVASAHPGCETPRRVVGYTRCGDPVIATYDIVGYARCGDPVREWVSHYPREHEATSSVTVPFAVRGHFRHHDYDRGRDWDRGEHRHWR